MANKYCFEAIVTFPNSKNNPKREHKLIAFRNAKDCFAYRNPYLKGAYEINTYSFIRGNGKSALLFEGFLNFLSALSYRNFKGFYQYVFVLNSVHNALYIEHLIKEYDSGHGFLDNDDAGDQWTEWFKYSEINYTDHRNTYKNYNDFNDFITGKKSKRYYRIRRLLF